MSIFLPHFHSNVVLCTASSTKMWKDDIVFTFSFFSIFFFSR